MAVAEAVATRSQSEEAYQRILERIVRLEMAPGSVVNEARLREELGIGRTPIREALQRLARENLVRSIPHRGTFVTDVNITDLARITEVRVVLEAHAARLAAEKLTTADREALQELLDLLLHGYVTDHRDLMQLDQPVHRLMYRSAHSTLTLGGEHQTVGAEQVSEVEANIRRKGYYPLRMSPGRLHELDGDAGKRAACFQEVMLEGVERWMGMAAEKLRGSGVRCFVSPGNDDEMEVDEVIRRAELVELGEGRVVDVDGFSMISTGWSNPTPWNTHREESEEKLGERIESMASKVADPSRAIFNLHCPPYKSGLDEAPAIDADLKLLHGGRALRPVGSTAVRQAIERHQPLLSLHGHIHESKGAIKIGKTLSINPGSAYEEGMLMGAIIQLDPTKGIKSYQLVNG